MEAPLRIETKALRYVANVTRDLYPAIQTVCPGLPNTYELWEAYLFQNRDRTVNLNGEQVIETPVDVNELREFCKKTGQRGQTALDNYAYEKGNREQCAPAC